MSDPAPSSRHGDGRLQRCIRDLAALNALPSLCIGRPLEEALAIVVDALPTALECDLVYIKLPGAPSRERASLHGTLMSPEQLAEVRVVTATDADGTDAQIFLDGGKLWCLEAEVPLGTARGRLVAGRRTPLDPETDRVLVRTAANVIGTTLETAQVLEVAQRKDDFLAMLGHELRNPLAAILTAVELLAKHPPAARERNVIERHTHHLARLVDDLLDISRVTHGQVELRDERISLASVLDRALEIASPLVSHNRHTLYVDRADSGLILQGDPVRLAQIFGNLLSNAAKFTPPGGQIDVLVEPEAGRVRVTVRDNGAGIARDQLERIFEPFVQADRERDALRGGLGLGLAIVKNLVERHQGAITVKSEGRGRGAAFTVELPTVAAVEQPVPSAAAHVSVARAGVRVLVVDDNVDVADLLAEALRDEGFETAVVHNGRSALERWRSFSPHAAVLDLGLPDLDGCDLARMLRVEHGGAPTLIAASGYGQASDRRRAAEAGFDCHLVKPVSIQDLARVLDERVVAPNRRPAGGPRRPRELG